MNDAEFYVTSRNLVLGDIVKRVLALAGLWLALSLPAFPAQAQNETVIVDLKTLAGVWKMTYPGAFVPSGWGRALDHFCRIEEVGGSSYIHCLGNGIDSARGTVTIKDGKFRMYWISDPTHVSIEGELQSSLGFTGLFSGTVGNNRREAPDPVIGTKQFLTEGAPDTGEKAALLKTMLEQIAAGNLSVPYDMNLISKNYGALIPKGELQALGKNQVIVHLGLSPKYHFLPGGRRVLAGFEIYGVEFDNGERICSLNQTANGIVDYFHCA